jgi:hypothetical protein
MVTAEPDPSLAVMKKISRLKPWDPAADARNKTQALARVSGHFRPAIRASA